MLSPSHTAKPTSTPPLPSPPSTLSRTYPFSSSSSSSSPRLPSIVSSPEDRETSNVETVPLHDATAFSISHKFVTNWISTSCHPHRITSGQSINLKEFIKMKQIGHTTTKMINQNESLFRYILSVFCLHSTTPLPTTPTPTPTAFLHTIRSL